MIDYRGITFVYFMLYTLNYLEEEFHLTRSVVLKVWLLVQQHKYYLSTC